jgi:putative exporter of polyketide antibiotics
MRPCLLLMLALVAVALAICGPPAVFAGQNDLQYMQTAADSIAESPAMSPALLPVVADPGSCGCQFAQLANSLKHSTDNASHAADQQRWRCRLLIRMPCG